MTTHSPDDVQRFQQILRAAWRRTGGASWEPPRIKGNPFFDWAVAEGHLKVAKGGMVSWTDAGRAAMGGK